MVESATDKDRDADGRFAPKGSKVDESRPKRRKTGGRKKGTPNKATRAWKEFVGSCADDVELQAALRERCLDRPDLLLRVAEHAVGKPKETVVHEGELKMFIWPDGEDIAD
jgi:hypothetical protein